MSNRMRQGNKSWREEALGRLFAARHPRFPHHPGLQAEARSRLRAKIRSLVATVRADRAGLLALGVDW